MVVHILNPHAEEWTCCGNSYSNVQWVSYEARRAATCFECKAWPYSEGR